MNAMEQKNKMVIYQVFPRWFGNLRPSPVMNGSLAEKWVSFRLLLLWLYPKSKN